MVDRHSTNVNQFRKQPELATEFQASIECMTCMYLYESYFIVNYSILQSVFIRDFRKHILHVNPNTLVVTFFHEDCRMP